MEARSNKAKKLTAAEVAEMRREYGAGVTQGALSRRFGVSVGQVGRIVRGESWQAGAGNRMPTQEEMDGTLARAMATQAQMAAGLLEELEPKTGTIKVADEASEETKRRANFFLED